MTGNEIELPDDLKSEFPPFETIAPDDSRYMAYPSFFYQPGLSRGIRAAEHTAADGSRWRIAVYNPRRTIEQKGDGYFPVAYDRLDLPGET